MSGLLIVVGAFLIVADWPVIGVLLILMGRGFI